MEKKVKRLDSILQNYAVENVKKLQVDEVVKSLQSQGIKNLEDLVASRLDDFHRGGGELARTTFIYEQFIYKESIVLDESIVDILEAHIKSLGK
jgi:beta-lactamase superfamily II metal-dependent hydrolase